ncbi:MAG: hypothetical protein PVJ67_05840 [Candidatus Pacearchaeota archaeon]|jgi:hypothetical protein
MTKKKGETKKKSSHKKTTKKRAKKKTSHKKTSHETKEHHKTEHHPHDIHVEKVLVENFVSLQKVLTNLSVKFDGLSTQISKLLELFEVSAKAMAQKDFELGGKKDEEMVKKIDNLLEQNKVIARGLTLLHEPKGKQITPPQIPQRQNLPMQKPLIQRPVPSGQVPPMPGTAQPQNQIMQQPGATPMMQQGSIKQNAIEGDESNINMASYEKSHHIDESQNVNFDIGRNEKEKKKDEFAI